MGSYLSWSTWEAFLS